VAENSTEPEKRVPYKTKQKEQGNQRCVSRVSTLL